MTVLAGALGLPRRQAVWGICQESLTDPFIQFGNKNKMPNMKNFLLSSCVAVSF